MTSYCQTSSITTDTFLHFKLQNINTKLHHMTDIFEGAMPLQKLYWRGQLPFLPPAQPPLTNIQYLIDSEMVAQLSGQEVNKDHIAMYTIFNYGKMT